MQGISVLMVVGMITIMPVVVAPSDAQQLTILACSNDYDFLFFHLELNLAGYHLSTQQN